jgi:1,4-alpha-glucan branching enzyme
MTNRNEEGDVEFRYYHPTARNVYLVGDFNGWENTATPMQRAGSGE